MEDDGSEDALDVTSLPEHLPQVRLLRELAADLWGAPEIRALWLGGSLARGAADADSDVDLRVAVRPDTFDPVALPPGAHLVATRAVVHLPFPWGEGAVLHHLMLDSGDIYDLRVQTTESDPPAETRLVLGCRDTGLGQKLSAPAADPLPTAFSTAGPQEIREIVLGLWINQKKHIKVLRRGLALAAWEGEHRMRQDLMRLLFVHATGTDCGDIRRLTIHTITPVVRAVQSSTPGSLALLGGPLGSEKEIVAGAARLQEEIGRIGRELAQTLGFDYPEAAEATVRHCWSETFS